ncbi:MAG: hypothetical protein Q8P67_01995 [archaeon]|nr:hypothetical protein [archaeon]
MGSGFPFFKNKRTDLLRMVSFFPSLLVDGREKKERREKKREKKRREKKGERKKSAKKLGFLMAS